MATNPDPKELEQPKPTPADIASAKAPAASAAWIPAVGAILIAPALCVALVQFVLVPRFQKRLVGIPLAAEAAAPAADATGAGAKAAGDAKPGGAVNSFDFTNVVVNLSGTMGTRYLKTSFTVTGSDPALKDAFESGKARLTDVTLNVLSAFSLAELEEPGAKNILRDKLVTAYNQTLGRHAVDQVYFSDFVVQ